MAKQSLSQRYINDLIISILENEMSDISCDIKNDFKIYITGRIYVDGSNPEDVRSFLEELVETELGSEYSVYIDGVFISRNLPTNFVTNIRATAQFPESIYKIERIGTVDSNKYRILVRHQDSFLGKKRTRLKKLHENYPNYIIEVLPLGKEIISSQLNTLPKIQEWIQPLMKSITGFFPHHIHDYKIDSTRESIWIAHNSNISEKVLRNQAFKIMLETDILLIFEYRISRVQARGIVEEAFSKLEFIEGYHISFQEKNEMFFITVDTEQTNLEKLQSLAKKLTKETDFKVEVLVDIKRDVMVSRLIKAFPEDGILTKIKHIDASIYEVEAYVPFDDQQTKINAWSDEMEELWGAKILFSEPFMRSPDVRYAHIRGSDKETIALRYNRPKSFSDNAITLANECAVINWEFELKRRYDFRQSIVLSIDPERTRDIDDALSITQDSDGTYEVGIHIADVSAFVPQGSVLDNEACLRGFTTYLLEGEIPVIPEVLANEVCSLHGNKDSLCMSVFAKIDAQGNMLSFDVKRTIIHNYARLSYAQAQGMLNGKDDTYAWQVRSLGELSKKMRLARKGLGALDLSIEEDPEKASHQLIEEFMLLANECVSRFLTENHPTKLCLFRIHPDVTESSLNALRDLAQHLKIQTKIVDQSSMQKALEEVYGTPKYDIFRFHLGRILEKATYHVDQLGHGALAKEDYAHFTSPIRRYTDLIIHRLIEDVFEKESRQGKACYDREDLQVIANHLNHMEVRVDAGSFESHRIFELQKFDGSRRSYTGKILSFMRGRMAIKLEQTDLTVYVRYRDFKQEKMMPIAVNDELTEKYFMLGDCVNVRTEGVDWNSKSIQAKIIK